MRTLLLSLLTALVLLGIAGPAFAHTGLHPVSPATGLSAVIEPATSTWRITLGVFASFWSALLLATLLPALRWRRVRRVAPLGLVLILSLFAFETALHSAHHLTDLNRSTQCVIASTSGHVAGTTAETLALDDPLGLTPDILARSLQTDPAASSVRLEQGRAPPSF